MDDWGLLARFGIGYLCGGGVYLIGLCLFTPGSYRGHALRALLWPLDMAFSFRFGDDERGPK